MTLETNLSLKAKQVKGEKVYPLYIVLDNLNKELPFTIDNFFFNYISKYIHGLHITDIKEKYGHLRIYYSGDNLVEYIIESGIDYTIDICYICGNKDNKCDNIQIFDFIKKYKNL